MTTSSNDSSQPTPNPNHQPDADTAASSGHSAENIQPMNVGSAGSPEAGHAPHPMKDGFRASWSISSVSMSPSESNGPRGKESDSEPVRRSLEFNQQPRYAGADLQQRLDRIHAAQYIAYKRAQFRRSAILFLLTFLSTFLVGSNYIPLEYLLMELSPGYEKYLVETIGAEKLNDLLSDAFQRGYHYSVPLMLILFCHEMGHYLQSVKYRVPASLPYFIPLPLPPMGTMGAVIFQGRGTATRKQMFDIAVSGPLAGLLITIPVLWYGIQSSGYGPKPQGAGLEFGEPLLVKWMMSTLHGDAPEGQIFMLNNIGFAGWVGVLITAMNLLPVGQLDGGHILYTLIGKPAHYVAYGVIGLAFVYMSIQQDFSFTLLLFLLLMTGPKHPPTANDAEPIGLLRHLIGWATLGFLVIGFTPTPIITPESGVQNSEQKELPTPEFAGTLHSDANEA